MDSHRNAWKPLNLCANSVRTNQNHSDTWIFHFSIPLAIQTRRCFEYECIIWFVLISTKNSCKTMNFDDKIFRNLRHQNIKDLTVSGGFKSGKQVHNVKTSSKTHELLKEFEMNKVSLKKTTHQIWSRWCPGKFRQKIKCKCSKQLHSNEKRARMLNTFWIRLNVQKQVIILSKSFEAKSHFDVDDGVTCVTSVDSKRYIDWFEALHGLVPKRYRGWYQNVVCSGVTPLEPHLAKS